MKTLRMVCGIISICLFVIVLFQSCAAGLVNAVSESNDGSGSAGVVVAFLMLVSGIVSIAGRCSRGAIKTSVCFYTLAGIIGIAGHGIFQDLIIWGVICFLFAILFVISLIKEKKEIEGQSVEQQ